MKASAHFVQKRVLHRGTTCFLCCTLWTDFDLPENQLRAMSTAQQIMRDYSGSARPALNRSALDDSFGGWIPQPRIKPEDVLRIHHDHRSWLVKALSVPPQAGDQSVVVTHHGPHPDAAGAIDALTPSFHSGLIVGYQPTAW